MEEKPRKRRPFQFSLRTMLIVTAILAVLLAWGTHGARQQRSSVVAIYAAGGLVFYEKPNQRWPEWLISTIGVDYFSSVVHVELIDTPITAQLSEHIKSLTKLKSIGIPYTRKKDPDIRRLQQELPNCEWYMGPSMSERAK